MTLQEFTPQALAQKSVSKYTTAGNSWKDGGYLGQCVSLINQYCWRVLNVPAKEWGNAKDWPSNPNVQQYFDTVSSPQGGDIGVMGAKYGGGEGHIFIYTSPTTILEQNGRSSLTVTTGSAYTDIIAILRVKGEDMALSPGDIDKIIKMGLHREPTAEELGNQAYANDPSLLINTVWNNGGEQLYTNPPTPVEAVVLRPGLYKVQ